LKKTVLHAALLALAAPMCAFGLGLGQMTVKSALDQPFLAEIEIVDLGNVALKNVKVNVAGPENFAQIGIERAAILSLLTFQIEKNEQGKEVVIVKSIERMSEPYMELVVDLAWPEGQLYKAYTILLDPPGYHLVSSTIQGSSTHYKHYPRHANEPGVIDKTIVSTVTHNPVSVKSSRKKTTYGPTVTNENVWQIAQRYKSAELILPQVVLSIVGANPEAFKEGNLNGLKVGVQLSIPATSDMLEVPAELATTEVMAHDKAWNDRTPIEHVLTPPYINSQPAENTHSNTAATSTLLNKSSVLPIPTPSTISQLIPNSTAPLTNPQPTPQEKPQNIEQSGATKAEVSITVAAIESVREANALLMDQLHLLQKQNETLQKQLDKRNKVLESLRSQMQVLIKQRQALPAQASSTNSKDSGSIWPFILLALAAGAGVGFAYWYLRIRQQKETETPVSTAKEEAPSSFIKPRNEVKKEESQVEVTNIKKSELMVIDAEQKTTSETTAPGSIKPTTDSNSENENRGVVILERPKNEFFSEVSDKNTETSKQKIKEDDLPPVEEIGMAFELVSISKESEEVKVSESIEEQIEDLEAPLEFISVAISESKPLDLAEPLSADKKRTLAAEKTSDEQAPDEEFLEFESGLHTSLTSFSSESVDKTATNEPQNGINFISSPPYNESESEFNELNFDLFEEPSKSEEHKLNEEHVIEVDEALSHFFVEEKEQPSEENSESTAQEENKTTDLLKNKKALDTLLALAKTYISMDDFESARHSLDEVIEHGTSKQTEEAARLLEFIKGKE
jgi:pilus assembly protein FimV